MPTPPIPYAEFDFDLARAVLEQLVENFDKLQVGKLVSTNLISMPEGQGVYQLYQKKQLRYVGKADSLKSRLVRHERALSARVGIDHTEIGFKALFIHKNWTTWTTETAMIEYFGESKLPWNASGYGSNDPGRKRDHTSEAGTFNDKYPINIDVPCTGVEGGTFTAFDALTALSRKLPFTLRFERVTTQSKSQAAKDAEAELKATKVKVPKDPMSVREAFLGIVRQLKPGWQATALRGRLILYREKAEYAFGDILLRT